MPTSGPDPTGGTMQGSEALPQYKQCSQQTGSEWEGPIPKTATCQAPVIRGGGSPALGLHYAALAKLAALDGASQEGLVEASIWAELALSTLRFTHGVKAGVVRSMEELLHQVTLEIQATGRGTAVMDKE
mmetsp:Transcript_37672/g.106434  ORF Transcript_37672/g.106434 Transcript_37672/m.106434 type:complete len:130 (+) Transcript_37672:1623-2012(+)